MLQLMRKHHKVAMIVVAAIVCITMVYFGQQSNEQAGGYSINLGGQRYNEVDIRTAEAISQMARGAINFGNGGITNDAPAKLMAALSTQGQARQTKGSGVENTLINLVTIRETARTLGIAVTDEDVKKGVESLACMQTDGKFDRTKFDQRVPNESAQRYFFQMMKDALVLEKLQKLAGGSMQATDFATTLAYNQAHTKTTIHAVIVPRKEHEALKATDEDAQKYYDANKEKDKDPVKNLNLLDSILRSEPSRNLSYVVFNKVKRDEKPEDLSKLPADQQEAKRKGTGRKEKGLGR